MFKLPYLVLGKDIGSVDPLIFRVGVSKPFDQILPRASSAEQPGYNATTGALSTTCTSSQLSGVRVERVGLGLSPVMNKSRSSFESFIDLSQGRRGSGTKASERLKHKGKSKTDS